MTTDEKKAFLLLKSLILHYHGLAAHEEKILERTASELNANEELKWANSYIEIDFTTAFERSRDFINRIIGALDKEIRLSYIDKVWQANNEKGYITEIEATAMLKVAKDMGVEEELIKLVQT
jgi:hypothetical protein